MAGKGPKHESRETHHGRENYHSKDGPRRAISSPPRPSGSGSLQQPSSLLASDVPLPMVGGPPMGGPPPPMLIEQKLAVQHAEIQRLLGDNERLAVTHITLRQELVAAQQEIMRMLQNRPFGGDAETEQRMTFTQVALRQELADAKQEVGRLQEALAALQAEKDHFRVSAERGAHMEAELKAAEALKSDYEKLRFEREELVARVEHSMSELKKLPVKDQEISSLKKEVDELRQRHQQARMDFELQKKINLERLEQSQEMERKTFTMARELERLRADLMNMERRLHGAYPASTGGAAQPPSHGSSLPAGAYENSYGSPQEATKLGQPIMNSSDRQYSSKDHVPSNADLEGNWVQQTAQNGKPFYYNTTTGATQWSKPSSMAAATAGADTNPSGQRHLAQSLQGSDPAAGPAGVLQQSPASQPQRLPPQQSVSPATMQQPGQFQQPQHPTYGVNLSVLGLSEGITDRDLASLFQPYGAVVYAKVMVDNKSGALEFYGIVTMENAQAADAAARAVDGMFILGRHIKVEVLRKDQQWPAQQPVPQHQQQGYPPQPSMQQQHMMMQGGAGLLRWPNRAAPPTGGGGRWPY